VACILADIRRARKRLRCERLNRERLNHERRKPPTGAGGFRAKFVIPSCTGRTRSDLLDLDLDVDASGEVETLERVDGLGRGIHDVEETLVDAHLEMLAGVLVLMR